MTSIKDRSIAVLATDGVEQVELTEPLKRFAREARVCTSLRPNRVQFKT
jgi:putative intracellular protease/amidase